MNLLIKISIVFTILQLFPSFIFSQTLDERIDSLISEMTLEEKILQLHKEGGFNTADNVRLNIPGLFMADGPHGVRDGMATCFPVGIAMAASWDPVMVYQIGLAMGREFKGKGKHQALGPCIDLCRDPRNGRSPESGGEDPYLISQITSSLIKGIQEEGVIATAKHFNGVNRQENRYSNNVTVSERLLMEHYGLNFRTAVQDGGVLSVMNAYNLINGFKCAENHHLLTDILRTYWGYPFYVVSDWNSIWDTEGAIEAGCNICMGSDHYQNDLLGLVQNGNVSESVIDDAVRKVLRTKMMVGLLDYYPTGDPTSINSIEHQQLALEAGRKSIILLKNVNNLLPLNKFSINNVAVIGPSANVAQLDGAGSSYVTPFYSVSPKEGIENKIGANKVHFANGCDINSSDTSGFQSALDIASLADLVIFFGGLDATQEGEGFDRVGGSTLLPGKQIDLINRLASVNPNIIVVIESGGICSINPAINNIKSLIYAFYPGQEGGNALADVIFGDYNPGGKLPVTMPKSDAQLPERNDNFNDDFGCGYRWYDEMNITPEFPFGFGLSYTTFQYSNLLISPASVSPGQIVNVSFDIKNTGSREGEEVVQLYITDPVSSIQMPEKQLKAFKRINLQPNETRTVTLQLSAESFYYFDDSFYSYQIEPGEFIIKVGGSSDNLPLSGVVALNSSGQKPDLKLMNIYLVPPYPLPGQKVIFLATIKNEGSAPSPQGTVHKVNFKVNGNLVSSSIELEDQIPIGAIKMVCANDMGSGSNWWIAGNTGTYLLEAMIDPENIIEEIVEDNNINSLSFSVFSPPPVNLCLNKNVVVSSVEGTGFEGNKAVDGNRSTRWSSQFSDPQFIYVDFGIVKHVDQVDLIWETAYGKEYRIDISNDAANWTTVEHIYNGDGGLDRIIQSFDTRYLRIFGIQRGTEWGYSLYEFEAYDLFGSSSLGDDKESSNNPSNYFLNNNYPNPFNPATSISYTLKDKSFVNLAVYNTLGEVVEQLVFEEQSAGKYDVEFNASNISSGIYFYRLQANSFIETKKMVLLK